MSFYIPVLFLFVSAFIWCHVVLHSCIIFICRSLHLVSRGFLFLYYFYLYQPSSGVMLFYIPVLFLFVGAFIWCHVVFYSCIIFICISLHQVSCCFLFLYYFYWNQPSSGVMFFYIPVLFLFVSAFVRCHVFLHSCIIFIFRSLHLVSCFFYIPVLFSFVTTFIWCHVVLHSCIIFYL